MQQMPDRTPFRVIHVFPTLILTLITVVWDVALICDLLIWQVALPTMYLSPRLSHHLVKGHKGSLAQRLQSQVLHTPRHRRYHMQQLQHTKVFH